MKMKKKIYAGILVYGLLAAFILSVSFLLLLAFILLKFQWNTGKTEAAVLAIYAAACLCGGWIAGRKAGRKKYLFGLSVGILYFLLLLGMSMISTPEMQPDLIHRLLKFLLCAACGMFGGILA